MFEVLPSSQQYTLILLRHGQSVGNATAVALVGMVLGHPGMVRFGLDAFRIPDSSDEFNRKHDLAKFSYLPDKRNPWRDPYWYRTEFTLPAVPVGQHLRLNFNCINYRADVWLNGVRIAEHVVRAELALARNDPALAESAVRGGADAVVAAVGDVERFHVGRQGDAVQEPVHRHRLC